METIGFYDFDLTSGSSIQAEALFDIFDDLTSIITGKRSPISHPVEHSSQLGKTNTKKKEYP